MSAPTKSVDNGVNVQALLDARDAFSETPAAGAFTWKATNSWVNGTHSKSSIHKFFGLGGDQEHVRTFEFDADHPLVFAAEDNGITPVEYVLVAIASCLGAGIASVAQQREIQLRSVEASVEADHDLRGILGDPDVRNGFSELRVSFTIDADASQEEIEALVAQSQKRSAVYDIVTNPTQVRVEVV